MKKIETLKKGKELSELKGFGLAEYIEERKICLYTEEKPRRYVPIG